MNDSSLSGDGGSHAETGIQDRTGDIRVGDTAVQGLEQFGLLHHMDCLAEDTDKHKPVRNHRIL